MEPHSPRMTQSPWPFNQLSSSQGPKCRASLPVFSPSLLFSTHHVCGTCCWLPARQSELSEAPTQRQAHTHFTHGRIQYEHVIESKRDGHKREARNNKCDICESDFVIQAITHFSHVSGQCVCIHTKQKDKTHFPICTHTWTQF